MARVVDATEDDVLAGIAAIDDDALAALVADPDDRLDADPQRRAREPAAGPGHRAARALVAAAGIDLGLRRRRRSFGGTSVSRSSTSASRAWSGIDDPSDAPSTEPRRSWPSGRRGCA